MLQLHGQELKLQKRRQLSEPNLFYGIKERRSLYGSVHRRKSHPRNGITANISGKKYFISTELLSRYPESLLSHKHKRKYFYDCIRNEYFFDRNRTAFETIFTFYVSKGRFVSPKDEEFPGQLLADELHFFGLYQYLEEYDKMNNVAIPSAIKKKRDTPKRRCQREVWKICEIPYSSTIALFYNLMSLSIIITSAVILCVDTLPEAGRPEKLTLVWYLKPSEPAKNNSSDITNKKEERFRIVTLLEAFCIAWFSFELFARFLVSPLKKNFFLRPLNVMDLLAITPYYISLIISTRKFGASLYIVRVLRLSKIFRVMKRSRYVSMVKVLGKTIKACLKDLWTMNFLILIATVVFGSAAYYLEQWDEDTTFASIPVSCWWALVTITTLGYGDMAPTTLGGKITGGICSVSGVLLITPFLPIIFNKFNRFQQLENEVRENKDSELQLRSKRVYTQYEINKNLIQDKKRRFTM